MHPIFPSLIANAATLGIHWIYNPTFLKELAGRESLFWRKQDPVLYASTSPSYFAYPHANVGDVSSQGMILYWLYHALKTNPNFSQADYKQLILDHFQPGGTYVGYAETYIYQLVFNATLEKFKSPLQPFERNDDHLVGFLPYFVTRSLNLPTEKAWELAQLFTQRKDYLELMTMFDFILDRIQQTPLVPLLQEAISLAPKRFQITLKKAIELDETDTFIKGYAGTACSIHQSVPILFHLLPRIRSFDDMLEKNALISGAISERGMLLAFFTQFLFPVPEGHRNKLNPKFVE